MEEGRFKDKLKSILLQPPCWSPHECDEGEGRGGLPGLPSFSTPRAPRDSSRESYLVTRRHRLGSGRNGGIPSHRLAIS